MTRLVWISGYGFAFIKLSCVDPSVVHAKYHSQLFGIILPQCELNVSGISSPGQASEHLQPAVRLPAEVASHLGGRANLPALRQRQLRPPANAEGQERVCRQPGRVCVW